VAPGCEVKGPASPGHVACLVPHDPPAASLAAQIARAARCGADSVEARLDLIREPLDADALRRLVVGPARTAGLAVIATCRGGSAAGLPDEQRAARLRAAADAGAEWLDVEAGSGLAARIGPLPDRCRLIVSRHDETFPADAAGVVGGVIAEARAHGPRAAAKYVPRVMSLSEALRLLHAVAAHGGADAPPLIAFGTGPAGDVTRLLSLPSGSAGVYWAADPARPAAPGQPGLEEIAGTYGLDRLRVGPALLGLAGDPIARSHSPRLHNSVLREDGRRGLYVPLPSADFAAVLETASALHLQGLSVTIPFKTQAARAGAAGDDAARISGAANTLKRSGDGPGWQVFNTDAAALLRVMQARLGEDSLRGATVLILGAGGAARGAGAACASAGGRVVYSARRREQAVEASRLTGGSAAPGFPGPVAADIVINATPLGGAGCGRMPLPPATGAGAPRLVVDFVYRAERPQGETDWIAGARRNGSAAIGGLEILIEQALLQQEIWFGGGAERAGARREAMTASLALQWKRNGLPERRGA